MIRRDHPKLSLSRQCRLLSVSRSSLYHTPRGESAQNLVLMRRIDELFLKYPFYGSRQMVRHLWREGVCVGRHRVRRLMRVMGLQAIYQAPRTTTRHPQHRVYPYLLKGLAIERPNQVWTADITYIPVQRGFLYLVAVMDWATRRVLSWRLSNTLDARFCVEALTEALERYGQPQIFNTDQGSQFTSLDFATTLKDAGVAISMDGRGRCMDNIFIERLWRSLKYEAVYLHELTDGFQAQRGISRWMEFYNTQRPHSALENSTPAEAYEKGMQPEIQAEPHRSPAASSTGTARRVKQDSGGMTDQPVYTLTPPPSCPRMWDHLSILHHRPGFRVPLSHPPTAGNMVECANLYRSHTGPCLARVRQNTACVIAAGGAPGWLRF